MKRIFFTLLMIATSMVCVGQVAQETDNDVINIETVVNVRFANDTTAILITKNNVTTFQVKHDRELVHGVQYTVFIQVQKNDTRDVIPAVLLAKSKSPRQIYSDIASLRKTFIKPENQ